jgi:thiol-disulfide isomerase/thioredoxin
MGRFWVCALAGLWLLTSAVSADAKVYDPPLAGDMLRLEKFDKPDVLPPIMLSKSPEGLSYLSEFKGSILIINLWATWCPPCIQELPSLNALALAMGNDDFKIITVSIDNSSLEEVKKFVDDNGWTNLPPYVDANGDLQRIDELKGTAGIPVTLILNRQLRVVARFQGDTDWNGPEARAVIEYYIKNLPPLHASSE